MRSPFSDVGGGGELSDNDVIDGDTGTDVGMDDEVKLERETESN